ncbi:hypothetical protein AC1031_004122 [Aphanomyces cochlioides]|nr:hypothetical protein AC1031_004122 [Aphanomyces cochlioides]
MVQGGPVLADPCRVEVGGPDHSRPQDDVNHMAFRTLPLVVVTERALPVVKVGKMARPALPLVKVGNLLPVVVGTLPMVKITTVNDIQGRNKHKDCRLYPPPSLG